MKHDNELARHYLHISHNTFSKSSTVMVFGRASTQYISTRQAMQHFVNLAPCKASKVCNEVLCVCVLGIV